MALSGSKEIKMNYHYTYFMIKERQRLELEESERNRMLRMAIKQNNSSPEVEKVSILKEMLIRVRTMIQRKPCVIETVRE